MSLDALNWNEFFDSNIDSRSDDEKDKMAVKTLPCNLSYKSCAIVVFIFWDIYEIFLPPQVKWSVIISNKNDIYELPFGFLRNLKLLKIARNYSLAPSLPPKKKVFLILVLETLLENRYWILHEI